MPGSSLPPVRVAIITLDNHLKGAVERAALALGPARIAVGLHAATDWERDPAALEHARAAIARADIVIVTMLFLDDQIRAVLPALEARREDCDAMVCLMSAGEVVRLTRMGGYRMDAPARGPLALLKKLRGSGKPGASSGAGQMRMLRRLPKILRFVPGTAQDVRAYFLTLQYWLAGSDENIVAMVRALVDRYAAGPRLTRRGTTPAAPPRDYPEVGVYHPRTDQKLSESLKLLPPARKGERGTVGLLLLRSYLISKDAGHYDGVIAALEAAGLRVIPAFANGLDSRPAIEAFFLKDGTPTVDLVISLTGFSLVGGPAYNDARAAEAVLARLDVPYIAAHALEFQSLEHWGAGRQGLLPLEATIMVAIPELDGAIVPTVFGGRSDGHGEACPGCARACRFSATGAAEQPVNAMRACPERAEALAAKAAGLIALRRAGRAERRLAITLFNFPPNAGATGSAAFLAVFESLHATLARLAAEGYAVEVPASVDALREAILEGNAARYGTPANVAARICADDHVRREPHLAAIEAQWGPAPGRIQSDGSHIQVLGAQFGQVFVGIQPGFGYEGDPMRLLFDGDFAPTHAFAAYYRYLREDFGAHAVLHFGTHGALEFMPGKQAGPSGACWPERLLGDLPNFYLYASNNPSEGVLAKRRSGATLVSYLTPSLTRAGLYRGFAELKAMALMGARPRQDAYGRTVGAELIPLAELGRPRIDVVVTLSGIFRDLLPLQTRMLAEAALLAAEADEPLDRNFVRKHALAHQQVHQCDLETAALRVFSNAEGAYGANVNQLIDGGVWADPDELANAFETRKGYAYGVKGPPVQRRALLQSALSGVDFVYQNLESVEVGITDLDQYVDGLGGVSRSVARAKGAEAPVYIVDATQGEARVRTLAEQIDLETRTRTLNPKWFEGMLRHGYEGVRSIEQHVTTTMGWSATTGQVAPWVYQRISETFVLDPAMRERLSRLNPTSSARVVGRLLEACERRLWEPDDETLEALRVASDELEDRLEGVFAAE